MYVDFSSGIKLYLNGNLIGQQTFTNNISSSPTFALGRWAWSAGTYSGLSSYYTEAAIWSTPPWSSNFTIPSGPYTSMNLPDTSSLISARYWRIIGTDIVWDVRWGNYHVNIAYMKIYDGIDEIGNIPVTTAYASSQYSAFYSAINCWDDSTTYWWGTAWYQTSPAWNYVDLGTSQIVRCWTLQNQNAFSKSGAIQYSNNAVDWTTIKTFTTTNTGTKLIINVQ